MPLRSGSSVVERPRRGRRHAASAALVAVLVSLPIGLGGASAARQTAEPSASGFETVKPLDQAMCGSLNSTGFRATYFSRGDCIRVDFDMSNTDATAVTVNFFAPEGDEPFRTQQVTRSSSGAWRLLFRGDHDFPAGRIRLQVMVGDAVAGEGAVFFNTLGAEGVEGAEERYAPGDKIPVAGRIQKLESLVAQTRRTGVPAGFYLRVRTPEGDVRGPYGPFTAKDDGSFSEVLPDGASKGITAGPETNFEADLAIDVVQATYEDPITGSWAAELAGSGSVTIATEPSSLVLEAKFVSATGWVKPGQRYPLRFLLKNFTGETKSAATTTITAPDGVTFTDATPLRGAGSAAESPTSVAWRVPSIAPGETAVLLVEARADSLSSDPEIVWKDLSTTARLTYEGASAPTSATSHGPKVIPPTGGFETARYGDKPFPIIPVDFRDRKHRPRRTGGRLSRVVNSPLHPGSTFNLYQEMSFGQLRPYGSVPSAGTASAGFDYGPGFEFTERDPRKPNCRGTTLAGAGAAWGSPLYPERIHDGWYQLPGDTEYYGGDHPVFTATTVAIDQACGNVGKLVFDAVQIADPEIDFNEFDSDKDGLVDFTMVVFVGCGGNGSSQLGTLFCEGDPPYDNPWPHSSSLEYGYQDQATGLEGYISDDQLTAHDGAPQCWTGADRSEFADCAQNGGGGDDDLPVHVRVGPYNINPEDAIDRASVIAHEYGHHLGLPDFYASYSAYNDWNLMAADYSQHMTVFSKQELGWVVPSFLQPGETVQVDRWEEIKNDTHRIEWRTPSGRPYTLSAQNGDQNVHNGEAYALKLPRRQITDDEKVQEQTSGDDLHLWWSGRGNDFGCTPKAGHNLDLVLPELEDVPDSVPVTMTFRSSWDIEWDYDYGFVLASTDGRSYTSLPSAKEHTTSSEVNPNDVSCLKTFDNGITGTSGAASGGPAQVTLDRARGSYDSGSPFVDDVYDLSAYRGKAGVRLRFSYFTDPGLDRPGWFIDDLEIKAGDEVIYSSDFSSDDSLRLFPGGCGPGGTKVAARCTPGWTRIDAAGSLAQDHGYYLELRDRSGFDFNGRGQSDRGDIGWEPGVLVEYTDEARGYGNNGSGSPPRQHYLDSQPEPDHDCGDNLVEDHPQPGALTPSRCQDAAFTAAAGDNTFQDVGWIDNFWDDTSDDGLWHFDHRCLTLGVTRMSGHVGNTEALPSDIEADATISAGSGCSAYDYGRGELRNEAPVADAQARPTTANAGEPVTFDGSGSTDDRQTAEELTYDWSFGDGATGTGQHLTHAYAAKGVYTATLKVTDADGLFATDTVDVTVRGPDLRVTDIAVADAKPRGKEGVTLTATVLNAGPAFSPASQTEFLLDGATVLGRVGTGPLSPGASQHVSVQWDTKGLKGEHSIRVTADWEAVVLEEDEDNNTASRTVTVKGKEVSLGSSQRHGDHRATGSGGVGSTSRGSTNAGRSGAHGAAARDGGDAGRSLPRPSRAIALGTLGFRRPSRLGDPPDPRRSIPKGRPSGAPRG